jgi:hypothetical protein
MPEFCADWQVLSASITIHEVLRSGANTNYPYRDSVRLNIVVTANTASLSGYLDSDHTIVNQL